MPLGKCGGYKIKGIYAKNPARLKKNPGRKFMETRIASYKIYSIFDSIEFSLPYSIWESMYIF